MTVTEAELQGFPADRRVEVDARIWESMRRYMLRMLISFSHIHREAELLMESCQHAPGCPAVADRTMPCSQACPDRERWLSANLCLQNAIVYGGVVQLPSRLAAPYQPPTREYFDKLVSELEALRAARDWLQEVDRTGKALALEAPSTIFGPAEKPLSRMLAPESLEDLEPEERAARAAELAAAAPAAPPAAPTKPEPEP